MTFISNLGQLFDEVSAKHERSVALHYPDSDEVVTYGDLGRLAKKLVVGLSNLDCASCIPIAIFHDKSREAFAVQLACILLGTPYVVLDPDSPWPRIKKILARCRPALVVNTFATLVLHDQIVKDGAYRLSSVAEILQAAELVTRGEERTRTVTGTNPAYIMFTSGSTGEPKGAVMSHSNVLSFIRWAQDRFSVSSADVFTNLNPAFFDNSVFDFYVAIFSGGTLVPIQREIIKRPSKALELIERAGCTIWFSVPSLLVYFLTTKSLTSDCLPSVRKLIFGGEGFPKSKLKLLYGLFGSRADLENVYGPTECTCICSAYTISPSDFEDMTGFAPLGQLSPSFTCEILSQDDDDLDFGELLLFGPNVGLGYYNDEYRTEKVFIQNPSNKYYAEVGYLTGDLVSRDDQGQLHFRGRADFQIKHLGYRIELEEIESALNTIEGVRESAVVYQDLGSGLGEIHAFVASDIDYSPEEFLIFLSNLVPTYMMPRKVHSMEQLKKNANGKIDRRALGEMLIK